MNETLDKVADDLAETLRKNEATRAALQAALDGQEAPEAVRRLIELLERLEAALKRVEGRGPGR